MKRYILIFLILFSFISFGQQNNSVDIINSNINTLNDKLANTRKKLSNLTTRVDKLSKENELLTKTIKSYMDTVSSGLILIDNYINTLKEKINGISAVTNANNEAILVLEKEYNAQNERISSFFNLIDALTEEVNIIEKRLDQLPEILFCKECYPIFSISFALKYFFELTSDHIKKPISVLGGLDIRLSRKSQLWLDVSAPFEFITNSVYDTINYQPTWLAYFGSIGYKYSFLNHKNVNIRAGLGLFYGDISFKEDQFNKALVKTINPWGLNGKLEISYHQFYFKNPLELYFDLSFFLADKNIVLKSINSRDIDFGRFLLSASLGFRFNFW